MKTRKTLIVGMALVGVMSLAGAAMAFTPDSPTVAPTEQTVQVERPLFIQDEAAPDEEAAPEQFGRRGNRGLVDKEAIADAVATELGITVEELEAAHEASEGKEELAEALGVTVEELEAAHQTAREAIVAELVADGTITEEQAEQILSSEGRQGRRGNGSRGNGLIDREAIGTATADALGITVEELDAAREASQDQDELAEALDVTVEELEAAHQTAREAIVAELVADGTITEEQAEQILSGEGCQGRRGGPRGPQGGAPDVAPDGEVNLDANNA